MFFARDKTLYSYGETCCACWRDKGSSNVIKLFTVYLFYLFTSLWVYCLYSDTKFETFIKVFLLHQSPLSFMSVQTIDPPKRVVKDVYNFILTISSSVLFMGYLRIKLFPFIYYSVRHCLYGSTVGYNPDKKEVSWSSYTRKTCVETGYYLVDKINSCVQKHQYGIKTQRKCIICIRWRFPANSRCVYINPFVFTISTLIFYWLLYLFLSTGIYLRCPSFRQHDQ